MKKSNSLLYLTIIILCLSLAGCKKDKSIKELLVGEWDITYEKYTNYQNNVVVYNDIINNSPGDFVLKIFADGTGTFYERTVVASTISWELTEGNKFMVKFDPLLAPQEVIYTVNKKSLTWNLTVIYNFNNIEYKSVNYMEGTRR
jgi:hypothetical protein